MVFQRFLWSTVENFMYTLWSREKRSLIRPKIFTSKNIYKNISFTEFDKENWEQLNIEFFNNN